MAGKHLPPGSMPPPPLPLLQCTHPLSAWRARPQSPEHPQTFPPQPGGKKAAETPWQQRHDASWHGFTFPLPRPRPPLQMPSPSPSHARPCKLPCVCTAPPYPCKLPCAPLPPPCLQLLSRGPELLQLSCDALLELTQLLSSRGGGEETVSRQRGGGKVIS